MKIIDKLSALLSVPAHYRFFGQIIGGNKARKIYLSEYVKPVAGEKILDIGCGPADILSFLPPVYYTGIDISSKYIDSAKKRFESRGRFYCEDIGLNILGEEKGTYDAVLAIGVLHHLNDEKAAKLFDLAYLALRPNGRLITYDGCLVPDQSGIARWLLTKDRGKFVRTREEYLRLASAHFSKIKPELRYDLLRIPYTHLIMVASADTYG